MPQPVMIAEDRSLVVPPGHRVVGAWVPVFQVEHANREPMAAGDIENAIRRMVNLGDSAEHPAPTGEWVTKPCGCRRFVVHDGRHEHLGAIARGRDALYVEWLEKEEEAAA